VPGYLRAPGVRVAPLGDGWAVFSELSGETHLVNSESVEVLNLLDEVEPRTSIEVGERLAALYDQPTEDILETLVGCWTPLVLAGLVRETSASRP
jgi:PqqD family protein of HPr-rel-A system